MSPQNERTIVFLSELRQIEEFEKFLSTHADLRKEGYCVIPLDAEIEHALAEKRIPFRSGRNYRTHDAEPMIQGEAWLLSLFDSEQWSFFRYRSVSLSRLYFFPFQAYLAPLLYYADIVANVLTRHPGIQRCIAFPPTVGVPPMGFSLEVHKIRTVPDVVACLAQERGKEVLIPESIVPAQTRTSNLSFFIKRMLFGWGIGILNAFVSLLRRPRRLRVLASDYWGYLEPYVKNLGSAEIFLLDRMQAFKAGFSNIWRFRMRFVHLDAYAGGSSSEREQAQERIPKEWETIKKDPNFPKFLFRGFSIQPLVIQALDTIIADVISHVLKDIDDSYALLARVKPDVVELRSTMSGQTHFVILAQVARALGIPSLEMQHGIEYYGPGSMDRRHSAEHMGVYGPLTQRELHTAEDSITTHVIGSPRFDIYASISETDRTTQTTLHTGITVLCIAPPITPSVIDTFDIEEYFSSIAQAVRKIQNVSVIIKFRPGPYRQSFYETAVAHTFEGVPHRIAQYESLAELCPQADIAVSNYSTATLEVLQCGTPLIYFGVSPGFDLMADLYFAPHKQEGALMIVKTKEELACALGTLAKDPQAREQLSQAAASFLKKEYAFDGKASKRAAALIISLASLPSR